MNLLPRKDRVIVSEVTETQIGSILLPGMHVYNRGKVEAVGPEVTDMKVGDLVVINGNGGFPFFIGAKQYLIMKQDQVHAVIE